MDSRRWSEWGVAAACGGMAMFLYMRRRRQSVRRVTQTLHPKWEPGQKQGPPFDEHDVVTLDPARDLKSRYAFFISAYTPRPIALVSSVSASGDVNLAPFSYSGIVNHDPGVVVFSCVDKRKDGGDTLKNVKATREFTVHTISEWFLEAANHTCGNFKPDVDEFDEAGLTKVPGTLVRTPRVAEAALALECVVETILPFRNEAGDVTATMVVGKVVLVHVNKNVFDQEAGVIVPERIKAVSRLGGNTFSLLGDIFDLARPKV